MESIYRVQKTGNFTTICNHHLNNPKLSFKAKGLHTYILSKPDNWKVITAALETASTDGAASVKSAIKELIDARYWNRYQVRKNKKIAHWQIDIYEFPLEEAELLRLLEFTDGKIIKRFVCGRVENV